MTIGSMLGYPLMLACIPVLVFVFMPVRKPKPKPAPLIAVEVIEPTLVQTEGITERRQDDGSFRRRWEALAFVPQPPAFLPPAIEVRDKSAVPDSTVAGSPPASEGPRHRGARSMRPDICSRHHMRKEYYSRRGWPAWRCRR